MKLQKKESKKIIIIIKDRTKTERFPTEVGNLNNKKKEKTEQKQKGLQTASGRP